MNQTEISHAGGIVFRLDAGPPQFLITTAKDNLNHWILPKGHIQEGEAAERAAEREVFEESGVNAEVVAALDTVQFQLEDQVITVKYFLMRLRGIAGEGEDRLKRWLYFPEALNQLTFDSAKQVLRKANDLISEGIDGENRK